MSTKNSAICTKLSAKAKKAIKEFREAMEESGEMEGGKIENILSLYLAGVPPKEIINLGFNKTTVYRQTGEVKKMRKAPVLKYYGFEMYEARIQRLMSTRKVSRDKAVDMITASDLKAGEEAKKEDSNIAG